MSYTEHRDCTAIRTYQSTNTVNYYLRIGKGDENTVLVASIEMDNNDMPIPRKGERIIFDIDSPSILTLNMKTISRRVKSIR